MKRFSLFRPKQPTFRRNPQQDQEFSLERQYRVAREALKCVDCGSYEETTRLGLVMRCPACTSRFIRSAQRQKMTGGDLIEQYVELAQQVGGCYEEICEVVMDMERTWYDTLIWAEEMEYKHRTADCYSLLVRELSEVLKIGEVQ